MKIKVNKYIKRIVCGVLVSSTVLYCNVRNSSLTNSNTNVINGISKAEVSF